MDGFYIKSLLFVATQCDIEQDNGQKEHCQAPNGKLLTVKLPQHSSKKPGNDKHGAFDAVAHNSCLEAFAVSSGHAIILHFCWFYRKPSGWRSRRSRCRHSACYSYNDTTHLGHSTFGLNFPICSTGMTRQELPRGSSVKDRTWYCHPNAQK